MNTITFVNNSHRRLTMHAWSLVLVEMFASNIKSCLEQQTGSLFCCQVAVISPPLLTTTSFHQAFKQFEWLTALYFCTDCLKKWISSSKAWDCCQCFDATFLGWWQHQVPLNCWRIRFQQLITATDQQKHKSNFWRVYFPLCLATQAWCKCSYCC